MADLSVEQLLHSAFQAHQAGRLAEAEKLYRQILAHQPNHADALHYLGLIAVRVGRHEIAIDLIRRAIACRPNYSDALNNLGSALKERGELDAAIDAYRRAIALNPADPQVHSNLGNALTDKGQFDDAIKACLAAIALDPNMSEAHDNLGCALQAMGQLDDAIRSYRQAIALNPNFPEAHHNLGSALQATGDVLGAIAAYRSAIASRFDFAKAHWNLALALCARGDFLEGWHEYEWRWRCADFHALRRNFAQPQWNGESVGEKTLLIHAEQGLGDTLQFIRYLPFVRERVKNVIVQCQAPVQRLVQSVAGDCLVVAEDQPLPAFDLHVPLLSLARLFSNLPDHLPKNVPYLNPCPEEVRTWQERLAREGDCIKVGLVWAGRRQHTNDRNRSVTLASLAALGQVPGVGFYSLQKGEPAIQAANPPSGLKLIDLTDDLHDFSDTAALVANLDLVISVDTSVAHLAGAMGKPVWVMLPYVPDWRWQLVREDSPWYPTMRLFRQPAIGNWDAVIDQLAAALARLRDSSR